MRIFWFRASQCYFLLLAFVLLVAGCSTGDRPNLGEVSGTITLDGEPMPDAYVQFKRPGFRLSQALTNEEGFYEMVYLRDIKGVAVGTHEVYIDRMTGIMEIVPKHLRLPIRYNDKTTLTADVQPGSNEINFELTSDSK